MKASTTTARPEAAFMTLAALHTPCLLLDLPRMEHNIAVMRAHLARLNVPLRPHLKTAKSVDIARLLMDSPQGPATVSTLAEAEAFADAGVRDILYAVGLAPTKLTRVKALRARGVDLAVIIDSLEQARAVAGASKPGNPVPALIEIDCDGNRAGLLPDDPALVAVGRALDDAGALRGVMTHAGASYGARGADALAAAAEQERARVVAAATRLRAAGLPCPVVSVGSTPTALSARDLSGVTEVRAGVFVFHDLVMAGIGVCTLDDIAVSVLTSVIGHRADKGQIMVDAGWMALSRDRGTASQPVDQGYGLVCDEHGTPWTDLIVKHTNQEHGVLELRTGSAAKPPDLPVGTRVRVLPNHACATAAQHREYQLVRDGTVMGSWPRIASGW